MGRYLTTTGTASTVTRTVGTTYNAIVNDRILCSAGGFTITLPLSPAIGDTIQVIDATNIFATNNVTINRNGQNIQGLAEDLVLDINGTVLTLTYTGITYGWIIIGS